MAKTTKKTVKHTTKKTAKPRNNGKDFADDAMEVAKFGTKVMVVGAVLGALGGLGRQ
jgi:hypothetical protein